MWGLWLIKNKMIFQGKNIPGFQVIHQIRRVMREKYLNPVSVEDWIRREQKSFGGTSVIWKDLVKV